VEYESSTGWRMEESHLASWYWEEPVMDNIGRNGMSFLCIFGKPYMRGHREPVGLIISYTLRRRRLSLLSCKSRCCIRDSIFAVLSLLVEKPRDLNFVSSCRIDSIFEI